MTDPTDRGLLAGFSLIVLWITIILVIALTGCGPRYDHGWTVVGAPVPDSYLHEIEVAAEVIRVQEGVLHREWGGTVTIEPAPFSCPVGLCAGYTYSPHDIHVVLAPALGLGDGVGTTAIEWEFCNAARAQATCDDVGFPDPFRGSCDGNDDATVVRCTVQATEEIRRRLAP